nr:TetR/AcrR family transcriptional regulator [Actinomadura rayongensis]
MCEDRPVSVSRRAVGRPRAVSRPSSGLSPREEILAAAGELFTVRGYAATSTREIAERAGIRQASMYHYFGGKEEILASLLESTVRPSLETARALGDASAPPEARLWALCYQDARLLCTGTHNLGALYLLPEAERIASFQGLRAELKDAYDDLLARTAVTSVLPDDERTVRSRLVFSLVESVILIRRDNPDLDPDGTAGATANAALRVGGVPERDLARLARLGRALLDAA